MTELERGVNMMYELGYELMDVPACYEEMQFCKQSKKDRHGRTHDIRILFGKCGLQKYGDTSIFSPDELPAVMQVAKAFYER